MSVSSFLVDSNENLFFSSNLNSSLTLGKSNPVTGLEWPRGFQEVKVPRFHDNGTGRW